MSSSTPPSDTLITITKELAEYYKRPVSDFTDKGDITCIEIISSENGHAITKEVSLPVDLRNWLNSGDRIGTSQHVHGHQQPDRVLRLLICPMNHVIVPDDPFPGTSFDSLANVLKLEEDYLRSEKLQTPSIAFEVPLENYLTGFVIKAAKWDHEATDFSFSCVFDPTTASSSCILRILTKDDLQTFKKRLNDVSQFVWYPYFIPLMLIEMRLHYMPTLVGTLRHHLYRLEKTTGTHKNYQRRLGLTKSKDRSIDETWKDPDFEKAPAELTSIASDCAYYESACRTRRGLIVSIEAMHQNMLRSGGMPLHTVTLRMFQSKIQFLKMWLDEVENRCAYLGKRAEIQVQMCNSLMAQRDNALNKRMTEASLSISRFSQMDSINMRTIAAVTLAFLPGTFMATLFSTGFFNFSGDGQVVSHWFWLYWVCTIVLTLAVYLGWYIGTWRKRHERSARFGGLE